MTGGAVPPMVTVTEKEPAALFPCASLALHSTGVVPTANVEPEGGAQLTDTGPSTASTAAGVGYETTAPAGDVEHTMMPAGSPGRNGGVVTTNEEVNRTRARY